jgi:ATP-dependent DNA helicase RecG
MNISMILSASFAFQLTNAQKVSKEIRTDMGSNAQMNRLLQGDVGSGENNCGFYEHALALIMASKRA